MKTLLISANTEQVNMAVMPLGLGCVAEAAQNAGHEVRLLDLMFEPDPLGALKTALAAFQPECIGISVRNIDDQSMDAPRFLLKEVKEVIRVCRECSPAPIVLGGAGFTLFPESTLAWLGADMGIAGEGEAAFPALLARLDEGRDLEGMPGLYLRGGRQGHAMEFADALDRFSLPAPGTLLPSASRNPDPWIPVQTRRGCAFKCSYCSTSCIEGTRTRKRSPERVAAWLKEWERAGFASFFFVDNTFNIPPDYAKELCHRILERKLNIRWQAIIYPKGVDRELVELMAAAGCCHVSLGFESGSAKMLRALNKRFSPEEVRRIASLFADNGIEQMGFLLLGAPGETRESVEESLAFADSLPLNLLGLTGGVRIYPGTALAETALQEGVVASQDMLLQPHFYLARGLENWLPERLKTWVAERPHVLL